MLYIDTAILLFLYMSCFYAYATWRSDFTVADIAWGLGFVLTAFFSFYMTGAWHVATILVLCMLLVWGVRLSIYILIRHRGQKEDARYHAMRKSWGKLAWLQGYFKVFLLQGGIMWVMSLPVMYLASQPLGEAHWTLWLLVLLGLLGIMYESIADYQLYVFKKHARNKSKFITSGLWKYSRHPNYFGEVIFWWSLGILICISAGSLIGLLSPIIITLLIRFVSGVPLLENKRDSDKAYQAYKAETNCMIPWFPGSKG